MVKNENMPKALINIRFLSSCSGSDAHFKNVATSLASWLAFDGVPSSYSYACNKVERVEC